MPTPEAKRVARVSPNTLYRELQGEAVLLQQDSGEYFGLDEVANRIWQLIVEKGDLREVETAMLAEYDVDPSFLSNDIRRVVDELVARGLIEIELPANPERR